MMAIGIITTILKMTRGIEKERDKGKGKENVREKEKEGTEKIETEKTEIGTEMETDSLTECIPTLNAETTTTTTQETATRVITITESTPTNVQIAMVSGAEPVEPLFLLNTDPSGMKMRALRWLPSTRRE